MERDIWKEKQSHEKAHEIMVWCNFLFWGWLYTRSSTRGEPTTGQVSVHRSTGGGRVAVSPLPVLVTTWGIYIIAAHTNLSVLQAIFLAYIWIVCIWAQRFDLKYNNQLHLSKQSFNTVRTQVWRPPSITLIGSACKSASIHLGRLIFNGSFYQVIQRTCERSMIGPSSAPKSSKCPRTLLCALGGTIKVKCFPPNCSHNVRSMELSKMSCLNE